MQAVVRRGIVPYMKNLSNFFFVRPRGKEKLEQLPCERILQDFEFSRDFLQPVSHGVKRGKFQKPVKIALKAVVLI